MRRPYVYAANECAQSFWHLYDKSLISLMASGLKRANQIFRTTVNTWWDEKRCMFVSQISKLEVGGILPERSRKRIGDK